MVNQNRKKQITQSLSRLRVRVFIEATLILGQVYLIGFHKYQYVIVLAVLGYICQFKEGYLLLMDCVSLSSYVETLFGASGNTYLKVFGGGGLLEAFRSLGQNPHEWDQFLYIQRQQRDGISLCHVSKKRAICKPERRLSQNPTMLAH